MYHHHSQQQGTQPFSNEIRPLHQPPPNRTSSDILVMGFQFPRPTQLPHELESVLAIRGARDMDHRLIEHMNQQNQYQDKVSVSGISRHGSYSTNLVTVSSDNQPAHHQGVDWSAYQPPNKLFVSPSTCASRHSQPQLQRSYAGANIPSLIALESDSPLPRASQGGSSGGGEGQSLYTPESAGSILASFGLSNEDLEVLSHYPDDQLTPDTLPFILRNIQINKSEKQITEASTSESSISNSIQDIQHPYHSLPLAPLQSPEVPSLLAVTQTAGKVIDYGHASRANDERNTREAFKREPLSSERIVKMFPSSPLSSTTKVDKTERHQVILEQTEPSKHGDQDYRRTSNSHCNSRPSPAREFPASSKDRNLDQDYRRDRLKQRASSESKSEDSSRWSLSSSSDSKTFSNSKKFPTTTMINDFSAVSPKVYPHTCSLCHTECDQEKDWVDHINTVNHTAACRDIRNKYPAWKPNLPSRSGRYGSPILWDLKDRSPSQPISQSLSSPSSSPPHPKHQVPPLRPHGKPYSPHSHFYHHHYTEHRFDYQYSSKHSSSHLRHTSCTKDHHPEKRKMESRENFSRSSVKRTYDEATRNSTVRNRQLLLSKQGTAQSTTRPIKSRTKPGTKSAKSSSTKKKKTVTQPSKDCSVADRLVCLIGIPNDASEQEVTNLVGSFGKINNVILMPCSDEKSERSEGQKASVCMVKAKDAQALANSRNLSIRNQKITSLVAKKPAYGHCSAAKNSTLALGQDKIGAGKDIGGEADQKIFVEKGLILITGLPESGWLESDIITLIEPYGIPSDIIMAAQNGKVLVSVPDCETAQEIVKVHTFMPAKIRNKEVKMIHLKQRICLSTPVALYNILMGSVDPVESPSPVTWSSLLVITNVPSLSASSEVQKLVQRFGTVISTLVLKNMVICEMATAAMALSVYKRFQSFPCIIQNNPLFFSRKPDSKARTKVIAAYADSSEGSLMTAAVNRRKTAYEKKIKSHLKEMYNDPDGKAKGMSNTEKISSENEALGKNKQTNIKDGSNYLALSDNSLERGIAMEESSTPIPVLETLEDYKEVSAADAKHDKTLAVEETKLCSSFGKPAYEETAAREIHKVTQEMVKALLVECQAKIGYQPNNTTSSTCGEQRKIQMLPEHVEKADKETIKQTKQPSQEQQEEEKKHQRQRTDRQARKETRERREKEKRAKGEREQDDRIRKDREKREDERREWEKRERKRGYGRSFSGDALCFRSQGCKQSSWRVNNDNGSKAMPKMEEQEEFPLNISDFVTVDEVGDVTDLPCSLSAVTLETTGGGNDASSSVQPDTSSDTPTEAITETTSNTTATLVMPDEQVSECETLSLVVAKTLYSQVVNTSPEQSVSRQTPMTCQAGATESQTASSNLPEDAFKGFLNCPGQGVLTSDSESPLEIIHEKGRNTVNGSQVEKKKVLLHKTNEYDKTQDKKGEGSFTETGYAFQASIRDECVKKVLKTEVAISTDYYLPPFDPNNPVGMEFLVPKTGFFCKACNRFFSGNKEINHCKTLKHYKNLQRMKEKCDMTPAEPGCQT